MHSPGIAPLGLYVHIPFCRSKCNYCSFSSAPPENEDTLDRYVNTLCMHLKLGQDLIDTRELTSIYVGGGTPSLLGEHRLNRIFTTIYDIYSIQSDAEITLEANPESASIEIFRTLKSLGLNRVSLGAQSFHEEELKKLGRIHSTQDIYRAVEQVRAVGIENLSLDLIFAIPGQTLEQWGDSLQSALRCEPNHLSAYGLSFDEGTPIDQMRIQGKLSPVLDETYGTMYDYTRQYLSDRSWIHYEISNWCQPERLSRHNQIYWNRGEYLAAGVSAHGMIGEIRYSVIRDVNRYIAILENAGFFQKPDFWHPHLIEERIELTPEEMASDVMIFGLRQVNGISVGRFYHRFGYLPSDRWGKNINRLCDRGLMEQSGDWLRLTKRAIPISNEVFIHFLD